MTIYAALKAKLDAASAVNAIVAGRIYPLQAAQTETLPLIVYDLDTEHEHILENSYRNNGTLTADCYAANYDDALALAYAVRSALNVYAETWGGGSGVVVHHCTIRRTTASAIEIEGGAIVFIATLQFSLHYGDES